MAGPLLTLGEIANRLALPCIGDAGRPIRGLATLASAGPDHLSFLASRRYLGQLATTRAAAVILSPEMAAHSPCDCLPSEQPYRDYARASQWFDMAPRPAAGVHPSAVVAPSAVLETGVAVAAGCVIGEGVRIGEGSMLGPGCVIGPDCVVGPRNRLHSRVVFYHGVSTGADCTIHSGAVLGGDGFGFAPDAGAWCKIAQLGGLRLGSRVEVGANTTIDRGALDDTVIGDDVIIDNQVQIAHNVVIGDGTAIAACVGIAGSARIGRRCTLAGGAGVVGHVMIADGVHVTAMSIVTRSIDEPGSWSSGTASMPTREWRRSAVRFTQLDALHRRVLELEKQSPGFSGEGRNRS